MFDCETQGLKMYELGLFNNIFVQLLSSSFGSFSFFLVEGYLLPFWHLNWFKNETPLEVTSEAYSECFQTSKMEVFEYITNSFLQLFSENALS